MNISQDNNIKITVDDINDNRIEEIKNKLLAGADINAKINKVTH
jgi:hypothetical protein